MANCKIKAPQAGIIASVATVTGSSINSGDKLFSLISESMLWQSEVTSTDINSIKVGQEAIIERNNQAVIYGNVREIAPAVNPETGRFTARISLKPPVNNVKVGTYLEGKIITGSHPALIIPQQSVITKGGSNYVMIVKADRRISQIKVKLGSNQSNQVEVLSGNLSSHDLLVSSGAEFLSDGDLVAIAPAGN